MIVALPLSFLAMQPAASSPPSLTASCTLQMKRRGFTTQGDAKKFGRSCLVAQGARLQTLKRAEVMALAADVIGADHALAKSTPADAKTFCPNYAQLPQEQRAVVWQSLLTAMARPESNYQAAEPYWEVDQDQYSVGLLQLSLADEGGYRCGLKTEVDLTDPRKNLSCGARILARWVVRDGRIGGDPANLKLGGGRYWSTLRERKTTPAGAPPADARDEIISAVRSLGICRR